MDKVHVTLHATQTPIEEISIIVDLCILNLFKLKEIVYLNMI